MLNEYTLISSHTEVGIVDQDDQIIELFPVENLDAAYQRLDELNNGSI